MKDKNIFRHLFLKNFTFQATFLRKLLEKSFIKSRKYIKKDTNERLQRRQRKEVSRITFVEKAFKSNQSTMEQNSVSKLLFHSLSP